MTELSSPQAMLQAAVEAIDAANSADPNTIEHDGTRQPKELCHGRLAADWLLRLDPDAGPAQQLAARAHHLRRWEIPRDSHPKGRAGYLKWRRELAGFHAAEAGKILADVGYGPDIIERVQNIIQKRNLKGDPQVQTHEDALCLVFFETQLEQVARGLEPDKLVGVLAKTLAKMSQAGREQAARLSFDDQQRQFFSEALELCRRQTES